MELTRRDAMAALAASGVAVGVGSTLLGPDRAEAGPDRLDDHDRDTLVAVAEVVYPAEVTGIDAFVTTYLRERAADDPEYAAPASAAVETLDDLGREWFDGGFVDLDGETRDRLLREAGADVADPDPDGLPGARIRYYLVNEVLYALYASPKGGKLVGLENPQGHPGGLASYQRGPRP